MEAYNNGKYQILWCLRQLDENSEKNFKWMLQYAGPNCEKIIVLSYYHECDFFSLIAEENKKIIYISVNDGELYTVISEYLSENICDTILMDSTLLVSGECIQKLQLIAHSDRTIAGVIPTQIKIGRREDTLLLYEVLSSDKETEIEKIDVTHEQLCHCLFLKGEFIAKLEKEKKTLFFSLEEKLYCMGKKIVKAPKVYVGKVCQKDIDMENIEVFEVLKKIRISNGKKNILYYLLADFQDDSWNHMGGTQLHVKDLVNGLKAKYNIVTVARDREYIKVTQYINNEKMIFKFYIGPVEDRQIFYDEEYAKLFRQILKAFSIDIVHVHHVLWMTLDIFQEAEKLDIPIVYTIHDYYSICPVLSMVNLQNEVCTDIVKEDQCAECIFSKKSIEKDIDYISFWREEFLYNLQKCKKIIVPSKSVRDTMTKYYPSLSERTEIIKHGIELSHIENQNRKNRKPNEKLKVAFIGDLGKQKGSDIIYNVIKYGNVDLFEWYLIGGTGDDKLYHLKQKNLTKHGWYKKEELSNILNSYQIDIICILSQVPETFCYTFSEAMACHIPVLVTDIGALGERIRENNIGWMVPYQTNYSEILRILEYIYNNPLSYYEKLESLKKTHNISIQEMLMQYIKVYDQWPKKNIWHSYNIRCFLNACEVPQIVKKESGSDRDDELSKLKEKLEILEESRSYKMALKWEKMRFPGKEIIEKILIRLI